MKRTCESRVKTPTWLQAHLRTTEPMPTRLYGSLDAAKVRIEPRTKAEKQAETEAWRDLKVGCWYDAEPVLAASTLHAPAGRSTERGQVSQRATHIRYYCDLVEAQTFGEIDVGDRLRGELTGPRTGLCV